VCYPPKELPKKSPRDVIAQHAPSAPPPQPDLAAMQRDYLAKLGPTPGSLHQVLALPRRAQHL
jgi:hypothetical protein